LVQVTVLTALVGYRYVTILLEYYDCLQCVMPQFTGAAQMAFHWGADFRHTPKNLANLTILEGLET